MRSRVLTVILLFIFPSLVFGGKWSGHRSTIRKIEKQIERFEHELEVQVEKKKKSRDGTRTEEVLQRIVEIHGELIALRRDLDTEKRHIQTEHTDKAEAVMNLKKSKKTTAQKKDFMASPLGRKLDFLLAKIRVKFASFMEEVDEYEEDTRREEVVEVETMVKDKQRGKKEREAEVYLRRKSKVKVSK